MSQWLQQTVVLPAVSPGYHLVTDHIERELEQLHTFRVGLAHLFMQHTSAGLSLNENADPTVRQDFAGYFRQAVPEGAPYFKHTLEGADDMPAHLKSSILGCSLTLPVKDGRFHLGTWQGIYLCEFRRRAGRRKVVVTLHGQQ